MKKIGQTSKEPNNKKYTKKSIIIYVTCFIIMVYFTFCIIQLIKQPTDIFSIKNGNLSEEESAVGYIIRNETVVQGDNYKNGMMQIVAEGERVAKGDSIFRYYSNNEEELTKKIKELDEKIQEAMQNETNLFSSDMKLLENQIQETLFEASNLKDIQRISEYKKQISTKINKKAKIAGELSPQGSYIRKLIEERSNYENSLNSGAEYIIAPESGIVSYRVDGLENILTKESFSSINKNFLEKLNLKTGQIVSASNESGKVIDNFEAYIAVSMDSENAKNAKIGDSVTLRLSNSKEIPAKIEYIIDEEESRLIIFKISNELELLSNYRKITLDVIWWSYTGLKVPNGALKIESIEKADGTKQDVYYVVRNRMGYTDRIVVKVLKQNNAYAIIKNYTTEELKKEIGYTNEQIKQAKTIVLHDEIVINSAK